MYSVLRHAAFAILAPVILVHSVYAAVPSPIELRFDKTQTDTTEQIVSKLYKVHYSRQLISDDLSKAFLDSYLDMLDPSKMYFYQKDIDGFGVHATKFDDDFKKGNLEMAFKIYRLYKEKVETRLQNVIATLENDDIKFSFKGEDSIQLDREDAAWITSDAEADDLWHRRVKLNLLNLKLAGKTPAEARTKVAKRYTTQLHRVEQENSGDVFNIVMNALTILYDPHTNYLSPRTDKNFQINMSKSLEGIGAVLQSEDEFTKVVRLVPGGPASRQGQLGAADRIVSVGQGENGELVDIVGWRLDEVVEKIRGPKNTVVKLEILPSGEVIGGDTTIVKIKRDKVELEDQEAQKAVLELPGKADKLYKLGIIHLPDFYRDFQGEYLRKPDFKSSSKDVARLIHELNAEGIDGMIIDLRNNGGGSLVDATQITDLFIDRGVVVQIKKPNGYVDRRYQASMRPRYTGPLVVLMNRLSASASEIFAGAIQDYGRGLIIGSRSFGKGTVQTLEDLDRGKLKLTQSKFYRVSGDSTQHRGVLPDIHFPSIVDESEVGESAYDSALPRDQIHSVPHAKYNDFATVIPTLTALHKQRVKKDPDFSFLIDQINFVKENRRRKSISLNEEKRLARKETLEMEELKLENKRRIAKGEKPYADLKAFKDFQEEEEKEIASEPRKIDTDGDTLLIESGNILVDMIELKAVANQSSKIAKLQPASKAVALP